MTRDRESSLDLSVAAMGRIGKADIERAIGDRVEKGKAILCSDAHPSYRGFAMDRQLEHHALNAAAGERVKKGVYHIQHVNSTHNRVKKWLDRTFWGVSTKYLQQYLDWFQAKEKLKNSGNMLRDLVPLTFQSTETSRRYREIAIRHQNLMSTQN